TAAGADAAERSGVCRVRPGAGIARAEGSEDGRCGADASGVSVVHGPSAVCEGAGTLAAAAERSAGRVWGDAEGGGIAGAEADGRQRRQGHGGVDDGGEGVAEPR